MRKALELETTAQPAAANWGSSSRAIEASRAAKIIFGAPSGLAAATVILATLAGMAGFKSQRAASADVPPSGRAAGGRLRRTSALGNGRTRPATPLQTTDELRAFG